LIPDFYSYTQEEDDGDVISYSFITSNGSLYYVYFDPYQYIKYTDVYPHLLRFGYAFGFQRSVKGHGWLSDTKIGSTISKIIFDFIQENGNEVVLLYHCDYADKKQKGRDKIFNEWYENSEIKHAFIKKRVEVNITNDKGNENDYYVGYLTSINNHHSINVENEFSMFAEKLVDKH